MADEFDDVSLTLTDFLSEDSDSQSGRFDDADWENDMTLIDNISEESIIDVMLEEEMEVPEVEGRTDGLLPIIQQLNDEVHAVVNANFLDTYRKYFGASNYTLSTFTAFVENLLSLYGGEHFPVCYNIFCTNDHSAVAQELIIYFRKLIRNEPAQGLRPIFNAYDTIKARIPDLYIQEIQSRILRDRDNLPCKISDYSNCFPAILPEGQTYQLWPREVESEEFLKRFDAPFRPTMYPVRTFLASYNITGYFVAKEIIHPFEQKCELGRQGPFCALEPPLWHMMVSSKSIGTWESTRETVKDIRMRNGTIWDIALNLCPEPICLEMVTSLEEHKNLKNDMVSKGFGEELLTEAYRAEFRAKPVELDPTYHVELADLLQVCKKQFTTLLQPEVTEPLKVSLEYICPGVYESFPPPKKVKKAKEEPKKGPEDLKKFKRPEDPKKSKVVQKAPTRVNK